MSSAMDKAAKEVRAIKGNSTVLVTGSFYAVSEAILWADRERAALKGAKERSI